MLLRFFLLFLLCESTVKLQMTEQTFGYIIPYQEFITTAVAGKENPSLLQLEATPDYPVAAGQSVHLHCSAFTMPDSVTWSWQHLENQTWREVGSGRTLTLTEPKQSGLYHCRAKSQSQESTSPVHPVFIISMGATVGENLGIAAFVLSLLALIINLAILFWLGWHRLGDTLTTSNTAAKGFPGPQKSPKEGLPQSDGDGDVYMNYTSTNQVYTDLDPTNMKDDNVYSSLS